MKAREGNMKTYRMNHSGWAGITFLLLIMSVTPWVSAEWDLESQVTERVLDNGFRILVVERHDTPVAFCNIYYNVGSVRERPGITGLSHLLEHMMFKGTKMVGVSDYEQDREINSRINALKTKIYREKFWSRTPDEDAVKLWETEVDALFTKEKDVIVKDEFWELTLGAGASFVNASTGQDITGYYVTLPANKIELQMMLESDRMVNSQFREFYTEKEVVREERRLSENSPGFFFREQLMATFYAASPYSWHVLGWDVDLQKITHNDLMEHYRKYYVPNNAMAIYVGDFNPDDVIAMAERYFGGIPAGDPVEPVRTREPPQRCEKRIHAGGESENRVTIYYHIPRMAHDDSVALRVAGEILSGRSGRLVRELVEKDGIASEAYASVEPMYFDGVMEVVAVLNPESGKDIHELETRMTEVIESLIQGAIPDRELIKSRNSLQSQFLRSLQQPWRIAGYLSNVQFATGDWRDLARMYNRQGAITAADVQRVAASYFTRENRVVGIQETGGE